MADKSFFDEPTEQSRVKGAIVSKYFWAWANVIIPSARQRSNKIAYIDLFAGTGRYRDETKSTPLLVLERAIQDKNMQEMLVSIFNDFDSDSSHSLEKAIDELPGIAALKHKPKVYNEKVGDKIVKMFEEMHLVPTLFFVDPWGYKGLSLRLINSVLKNWGCDCILFFNYNRINMGLQNPIVKQHMDSLFGEERANELRRELEQLNSEERELAIVEALGSALQEMGGKYVLPFCFKNEAGTRTSHHLILVTKNVKGYEIMKEIMAKESSDMQQGVPTFEYNPASLKYPMLFELSRPLDDLGDMLLQQFAGETMTMAEVYNQHHVGRPYIKGNYKSVLAKLESEGKIRATPRAVRRRKVKGKPTFADGVVVKFPARS
ncbi:MAG: three-Cys-motif partner protein TcmP [Candidatus Binatia bacterium]